MVSHKKKILWLALAVVFTCCLMVMIRTDLFTVLGLSPSSLDKSNTNSSLFFSVPSNRLAENGQPTQRSPSASPSSSSIHDSSSIQSPSLPTTESLSNTHSQSSILPSSSDQSILPSSSISQQPAGNGQLNIIKQRDPNNALRAEDHSQHVRTGPGSSGITAINNAANFQSQTTAGPNLSSSAPSSSNYYTPPLQQPILQPAPSFPPSRIPPITSSEALPSQMSATTSVQEQQPLQSALQQQLSQSSSSILPLPSSSSLSGSPSKKSSSWFPSIPASSCQGIFQFTIDGTAYLKKISQRLHNVTLQIESVNGDSVSARLWIDRQDNSDAKAINFDLRNLENNCKHITYDNSTTNKNY